MSFSELSGFLESRGMVEAVLNLQRFYAEEDEEEEGMRDSPRV